MTQASLALALVVLGGCSLYSTRPYRGPRTDHFDGEAFFNPRLTPDDSRGFFSLVKWLFTRERGEWPDHLDVQPGPKPPERVGRGRLRVTFINHATVLIQMDGLNVLTDPVWSESVGPAGLPGVERVRPPGVRFEDLPPIDLILISHNHYDHCDLSTLHRLAERFHAKIAAGLGTANFLRANGIDHARDFDWWSAASVAPGVRLTAVPMQHFSGRGLFDRNTMLWTGFVLSGPSGRVLFAGDTGYGPHFAAIGRRLGPLRLALLPIGAYRPRWFMHPIHMDPAQAVKAHRELHARTSIAIHFGTFAQADDGFTEPVQELSKAVVEAGLRDGEFLVLPEGRGYVPR